MNAKYAVAAAASRVACNHFGAAAAERTVVLDLSDTDFSYVHVMFKLCSCYVHDMLMLCSCHVFLLLILPPENRVYPLIWAQNLNC